jgi:recombination associated protein RdgC
MWFKNLKLFRLSREGFYPRELLETQLQAHAFVSQSGSKEPSIGWVPPRLGQDTLVVQAGTQLLCALRIEKKLLPSSVVQTVVRERATELEAQQGFKPGRKQIKDLKEQVIDELTPRAFSIARDIHIWLDPVNHWFVIDSASTGGAEQVLSLIGKSLYPYPIEPLILAHSPSAMMTNWMLNQSPPSGITLEQDCQWQSSGQQAGLVRYVRTEITPDEIERQIKAGNQCNRLGLTWQGRISFVLTDQFEIKRLQALDILDEQDSGASLDAQEKLDADFALMTAEVIPMLEMLLSAVNDTTGE